MTEREEREFKALIHAEDNFDINDYLDNEETMFGSMEYLAGTCSMVEFTCVNQHMILKFPTLFSRWLKAQTRGNVTILNINSGYLRKFRNILTNNNFKQMLRYNGNDGWVHTYLRRGG